MLINRIWMFYKLSDFLISLLLIVNGNKGENLMSNSIKDIFDKQSLIKDINEREKIILDYQNRGILDRNSAIKKIQELRIADKDVASVTALKLATFSVPFTQATNKQLVEELIMQRNILQTKLVKSS